MNDCEWPEVPEFSCKLRNVTMSDSSQMRRLLLKLTELTVSEKESLHLDGLIPVRLENLSVLKLEFIKATKLQCLNDVLKQGFLPNLSQLELDAMQIELDTFLREFDLNHTGKLQKLALQSFIISAEELGILSEKLTAVQLTELDLSCSRGLTGNLSALFTHSLNRLDTLTLTWCNMNPNDVQSLARANVEGKLPQLRHLDISGNEDVIIIDLFTHSFPRLNTLILSWCDLNSNDVQSLARANVEGKLPQLRHLDISYNDNKISDLFTHSAQWNQLTSLKGARDLTIPNVEHDLLTSLEELHVSECPHENHLPPITRCWSGLKTIELYCGKCLLCIADSVERGMFPDLTIVRYDNDDSFSIDELSLFKLLKANIFVRHTEL